MYRDLVVRIPLSKKLYYVGDLYIYVENIWHLKIYQLDLTFIRSYQN